MSDNPTPKKRGRKPMNPGEPMVQKTFTMAPMTLRKLRVLGPQNMSEALRKAIDEAFDRYQRG